jgi:K+-transporting ATPase KdpF subunit
VSWDSRVCGQSPKPAIAYNRADPAANQREEFLMFDYVISLIVAVLLLIYLGWAMFQPEKF